MEFYNHLADYYHHIFPLNPEQVLFTNVSFPNPNQISLLEAGCGVGLLAMELAKTYQRVVGIDLDEKMLQKAEERKWSVNLAKKPVFYCLNMLSIFDRFGEDSFDGVICYGNTLVHLDSEEQVLDFFTQSRKVLKSGGKLLFQILNYDRITREKISLLPVIENDLIRFERYYEFPDHVSKIVFKTILRIKKKKDLIENQIQLLPLTKNVTESLLFQSGFTNLAFFGDYQCAPFSSDSEIFVVAAS